MSFRGVFRITIRARVVCGSVHTFFCLGIYTFVNFSRLLCSLFQSFIRGVWQLRRYRQVFNRLVHPLAVRTHVSVIYRLGVCVCVCVSWILAVTVANHFILDGQSFFFLFFLPSPFYHGHLSFVSVLCHDLMIPLCRDVIICSVCGSFSFIMRGI